MYENDEDFEQELREGLRLRDAPAGFGARLNARIADGVGAGADSPAGRLGDSQWRAIQRRNFAGSRSPVMRWAVAAALLFAVGLGGYTERQRQERGERARQQVLLALRITNSTLLAVHRKVVDNVDVDHGR